MLLKYVLDLLEITFFVLIVKYSIYFVCKSEHFFKYIITTKAEISGIFLDIVEEVIVPLFWRISNILKIQEVKFLVSNILQANIKDFFFHTYLLVKLLLLSNIFYCSVAMWPLEGVRCKLLAFNDLNHQAIEE